MCRRILVTLQRIICWDGELPCLLLLSPVRFLYVKQAFDYFKACLKSSLCIAHAQRQTPFQINAQLILLPAIFTSKKPCCFLLNADFMPLSCSYDSEGRLTNVTFPTGVVTNLHGDMDKAITVDIESSSREEDVSITSNLSSIDSFYTMVQGNNSALVILKQCWFPNSMWEPSQVEVKLGDWKTE